MVGCMLPQVVMRQAVYLSAVFTALSAAALLPAALAIARQVMAAAPEAVPAAVDENDYTCLGLPWLPIV